ELIHNERNGFIVEPFDHIQMAARAIDVLQDAAMYRRFSAASREIAQGHELHHCADILEQTYTEVSSAARQK
ncbi:MAG: glycosyltransferase family 4 protein, partial [Leptospiraceae bacterium]|nr:glycosyltransferase family 4 protein [Leptospiraceae bacterium]